MKHMGVSGGEIHLAVVPGAVVGQPSMPLAPDVRMLATVLFTDVVDSTRRAIELGDGAWMALQERHETMVRREVRRFGGRCVSTAGDGLVATFDGAAAGVRCATTVARASRPLGLEVRAGLHCGECVRRGSRVGGIVFHVAARVVALARPGEVLVSAPLVDLVSESDLRFAPRGRHALRGLPGSWPVYAATDPGERAS